MTIAYRLTNCSWLDSWITCFGTFLSNWLNWGLHNCRLSELESIKSTMLRKVNGRLWGPIAMDWWRLWIVISLIFWYCQNTAYSNFRWRCMTATVLDDGHWSSKSFMEYICDNQVHIVWQSWVWIVSCTSFAIRCFLGDAGADQRERDLLLQTISSPVVCLQWNSCGRPDGCTCFTSSHPSDL